MADCIIGEGTRLAEESLYTAETWEEALAFLKNLGGKNVFHEKTLGRMRELGFCEDGGLSEVQFLCAKCREAGVELAQKDITLRNWMQREKPDGRSEQSRENVYQLCFALQMDEKQTEEFFAKAYMQRPFNFKQVSECVYYFCLKKGLPYQKAREMIGLAQGGEAEEEADPQSTHLIAEHVRNMDGEDRLIAFLRRSRAGFAHQNQSALRTIEGLLEDCADLAAAECHCDPDESPFRTKTQNKVKAEPLLRWILGMDSKKNAKFRLPEKLPKQIRSNFPSPMLLSKILSEKTTSYETRRKAMILLKFYSYFESPALAGMDAGDVFDDFTDTMDAMLEECGYEPLYYRNPYDWLFCFCAFCTPEESESPINLLQDILLSMEESDNRRTDNEQK